MLFLVDRSPKYYHEYLYEYDSETNRYKIAAFLDKEYAINYCRLCSFEPTLAGVHKTLPGTVHTEHMSAITPTLDQLKRFITEGTS